jgi:outer membrane protein OmpA-like peptidoglycan-associated protein
MRRRLTRRGRIGLQSSSQGSLRDADLFWATLTGEPATSPARSFQRRLPAPSPLWRQPVESLTPLEGAVEVYDESADLAEALPAGQTASPCDIAKTSETLDGFGVGSSTLTSGHATTIRAIATCLLALRASPRPIRIVDISGFTDTTGSEAQNLTLGKKRADAVREALEKELEKQTPGSAASFAFRTRSLGKTQQIAGGGAANRRVEVFVEVTVSTITVHATAPDTHKIASNLCPAGLEHFCCVRNTGNIVLVAEISPAITGNPGARLTWAATGAAITSPGVGTDVKTARMSSAASGKFPIRVSFDGTVVRNAVVWVIFSTVAVLRTRAVSTRTPAGALVITAGIDHAFRITPPEIITDADRPDIHGPAVPVPGAALPHVVSGTPLGRGACGHRWDASRQIRIRVLNPHLYPVAPAPGAPGLPPVGGHLWAGQPVANTVPENYPADNALGNDDSSDFDPEQNSPYCNAGAVEGTDDPQMPMLNTTGANGDTFEVRFHYREFLRVNLGTRWYRASDFSLWRVHFRFLRAGGVWTNNGSTFAQNNTGF